MLLASTIFKMQAVLLQPDGYKLSVLLTFLCVEEKLQFFLHKKHNLSYLLLFGIIHVNIGGIF